MNAKTLAAVVLGLGLIWATGCGEKDDPAPKADDKKNKDEDHPHGTEPEGDSELR
jgi:hypothetical protein